MGEKLLKLTAPYINTELKYKNPFAIGDKYPWNSVFKPYGGNYVSSIESIGKDTVYDITVADNHNFCTTRVRDMNSVGCIVHNCQDSNGVTLDIVLSQKRFGAQLIVVGDEYQAIYAWRGASNAFDKLGDDFKELYLTESFRFTKEIAEKATSMTNWLGNDKDIVGKAAKQESKTHAIIARTNATILQQLLETVETGLKVFLLLDTKTLWSKLYHVDSLLAGNQPKYPDKELKQYKTKESLYIASETLPEIKRYISMCMALWDRGGVHTNIQAMKACIVKKPELADYTLTTCHKAKGLEWDTVTLTDDFFSLREDESIQEALERDQTGNLIYVGITRAKYQVILPRIILEIL